MLATTMSQRLKKSAYFLTDPFDSVDFSASLSLIGSYQSDVCLLIWFIIIFAKA